MVAYWGIVWKWKVLLGVISPHFYLVSGMALSDESALVACLALLTN